MIDISKLTEKEFFAQETAEVLRQQALYLIDHLLAPEAYQIALSLEQKIDEFAAQAPFAPKIFAFYRKILIRLKFVSLMIWDNDIFFDLIKNHLADILGTEIDINERMTGKLYSVPDLAWPETAWQIIEALRQNSQSVGSQPLIIQGEPAPRPPLIKYWLLDYGRTLGSQRHENIERAQYFAKSRNYQNLNEADKIKVKQLLEFYDNLKPLPLLPEEIAAEQETEEEYRPLIALPRQKGESDFYKQEEEPYYPAPQEPPPQKIYKPPTPSPASPPPLPKKDTFREQVQDEDLAGPQAARRPAPKLDGNIVNLKDFKNDQS